MTLTMSSTVFPKVAFIKPPMTAPHRSPTVSDASDTMADSGIMARKLRADI